MSYLHLNKNDLFNDIPTELGKLTLLRELWLWENGEFQMKHKEVSYFE
jgi:hypothetical protein